MKSLAQPMVAIFAFALLIVPALQQETLPDATHSIPHLHSTSTVSLTKASVSTTPKTTTTIQSTTTQSTTTQSTTTQSTTTQSTTTQSTTTQPINHDPVINSIQWTIARAENDLQHLNPSDSNAKHIQTEMSILKRLLQQYEAVAGESLIVQLMMHETKLKHFLDRVED